MVSLTQDATTSLAVSRRGRVWMGTSTASTLTFPEEVTLDSPLSAGISNRAGGVVSGHGALWELGAARSFTPVPVQGGVQAAWLDAASSELSILLNGGLIVEPSGDQRAASFCWSLQLGSDEPVIAAITAVCGIMPNKRVITAHSLISQNVCVID